MKDYEKTIYLYNDDIGRVDYVEHMGDDLSVVNSARVSFGKQKEEIDEKDKKLIKYLIKHRHTSTLEHNVITFRFVVPLFVRSQHHRHRTWSYNEISRRYTDFDIKFYTPEKFRTQHKSNRQASNEDELIDPILHWGSWSASKIYREHAVVAHNLFKDLLRVGVCREQARGILPQTMYTEYYGTVNLSNLLKFIDLRTHDGAQWEIQKVAEACLEIATDLYPETVGAYREIRNNGH
jgi:thymidylate synthase (FAD)